MSLDVTFDTLLTAAGAGIAGGIITAFVELIKGVLRTTGREVNGAILAFVFSAVLYIIALFATDSIGFDPGLQVFLAWLTCAVASVGIYTSIRQVKPSA